ncbi:anti-sigma factor [Segeticoccus rhizosphaerae]|jgi:anti-sigma-K factor RskA|uniref:anti-sigma factor n=3 Tax=Segeticoccus rhizosphaerae TaxID=1104777 RepID=UPI0010C132A7|nr:anti-sigma factor [Ornithinicoccus soli]
MNDEPSRHVPEVDEGPHALAAAYALDALDSEERTRFEEHLSTCAECQREVGSLREAGTSMSALSETEPPPSLRQGVLAGIRETSQDPVEPTSAIPARNDTDAPLPGRGAADELATRRGRRPQKSPGRWAAWVAGAAAALVLVVGGLTWHPWSPDQSTRQLTAVEQVTRAPDAQRFVKPVEGATVTVVRSSSKGRAVIVAKGMPEPPAGHVYEVWYFDASGHPVKAGLMPRSDDHEVTLLLDGDAADAHGAGVTVEPAGGSDQPTTKPLVTFDFA